MTKFAQGQKLSTRSICNHDCIFRGEVLKRTAKTVTIDVRGEAKRCKVHLDDDGTEFIFPFGRYSMAAIFRAGRQVDEN